MKKVILIAVVGLILFFIFNYAYTQERITLSTYYPAPYGEYRKLAIGSSTGGYTAPSAPDIDLLVEGGVGIGTTSPATKLHVSGTTPGGVNGLLNLDSTNSESTIVFNNDAVNTKIGIWDFGTGADNWFVHHGGDFGLVIEQNGNVGIGTTSPGAKLHVGGTAGTDGIMFPDGSLQTRAAKIYSAIGTTDISVDSASRTTMSGTTAQIPSNFGGGDVYVHFNAAIRKRGWMWIRLVLDLGTGSEEVLIGTPQTDLMSGVDYGGYGYAGGPPVSLAYVKQGLSSGSHTIIAQWKGNLSQDGALSPRVMTVIAGE